MNGKRPNEADPMREAKRDKMRKRRVSFAPDDELETMHLFPKDGKMPLQDVTDTGNILLDNSFLRSVDDNQACPKQQQHQLQHNGNGSSSLPAAVASLPPPLAPAGPQLPPQPPQYRDLFPQSPDPLLIPSPASMDISLNSPFPHRSPHNRSSGNGHSFYPMPVSGNSGGYFDENGAPYSYTQQPPLPALSQPPADYTRSITMNLPGLSTLVEEDEEAGMEAAELSDIAQRCHSVSASQPLAGGGPQGIGAVCGLMPGDETDPLSGVPSALPRAGVDEDDDDVSRPGGPCYSPSTMSPATPAVLNLPRGERDGGTLEKDSVAKERWGFVPGAEDTLEIDAGHAVMGDATYNHVYGSGTTSDITKALRGGQQAVPPPGHTGFLALPAVNRRLTASLASLPLHHAAAAGPAGVALAATVPLPASPPPPVPPAAVPRGSPPDSPPPSALRPPSAARHFLPASAAALSPARYRGLSRFGAAAAMSAVHVAAASLTPVGGPATEMTMRLLQDDDATGHWRHQPLFPAVHHANAPPAAAAAAPPLLQPPLGGGGTAVAAAALPVQRSMYASLEAVAAVGGDGGGADDLTFGGGANYTTQLLADTATAQFTRRRAGAGGAGLAGGLDVTCASSSGAGTFGGRQGATGGYCAPPSPFPAPQSQRRSQGGPSASQPAQAIAAAAPPVTAAAATAPPQLPAAAMGGVGGSGCGGTCGLLMDGQDLTLDDFALPPEPADAPGSAEQQEAAAAADAAAFLDAMQREPAGRHGSQGGGGQEAPVSIAPRPMGVVALEEAAAVGDGRGTMEMGRLAVPVLTATLNTKPQRAVPAITFADFLHFVELRFLDDMRRKSVLHPPFVDLRGGGGSQGGAGAGGTTAAAAAPALGIVECYQRVHVDGVKGPLLEGMASNVAAWIEDVEARIGASEVALARHNPPLFTAVQVADCDGLDELKYQMKQLKKVARNRTVRVWKQLRTEYEQALAHGLRDSMAALQADAAVVQGCLAQVADVEAEVQQLREDVVQQAQADQAEQQAAARRQERHAAQRQRLAEVESANQQREQRLAQAELRRSHLQRGYEDVLQRKAELQRSLQVLRNEAVVVETPSKELAEARRLRALEEELDVLLGLQGLRLDASQMVSQRKLSCTVHGQFLVTLEWPQGAAETTATATASTSQRHGNGSSSSPFCHISAELLPDGFLSASAAASALQPLLAATAAAARRVVSSARVRAEVGQLLSTLWRCSCLVEEVGAAWQAWPQLTKVSAVVGAGVVLGGGSSAAGGVADTTAAAACTAVVLTFVHGGLHTKASVGLPWDCLLHGGGGVTLGLGGGAEGPPAGGVVVRVHLPAGVPPSVLEGGVMRRLSSSAQSAGGVLRELCHFMCGEGMALLAAAAPRGGRPKVPAAFAAQGGCSTGAAPVVAAVAAAVLYDNPLFSAAT